MATPLQRLARAAAYGARQGPRLAWYVGHGMAMRRLSAEARARGEQTRKPPKTDNPVPSERRLYADLGALLRRDLANVEAGLYPIPADHDGSLPEILRRSRLFFSDLPSVNRRREENDNAEVLTEETKGKRPRYYLQNFHFQSDGWLSDDSAARYDTQVEVLFNGTANAMRRMAIPPIREWLEGRDQRQASLVDVACGTGRFLDQLKQSLPRLPVVGVDLSEPYIAETRRHLRRWSWVDTVVANAEVMPFADGSQDLLTSIYLFHELPPKIRRVVLAEMARVLKPGGRAIIVDSLQTGDVPGYDGLLDIFPQNFHEPYFTSYLKEDFTAMAAKSGLRLVESTPAFVSKVMVFESA